MLKTQLLKNKKNSTLKMAFINNCYGRRVEIMFSANDWNNYSEKKVCFDLSFCMMWCVCVISH